MHEPENDEDDEEEELFEGGNSVGNLTANRMAFTLWMIGSVIVGILFLIKL